MSFIAGPYTATYPVSSTPTSLGVTEDGFELEDNSYAELIRGDNAGDSVQDGVYRGRDVFISFVCQEWDNAALHAALNPYGADALPAGEMGVIGVLMTSKAQQIVLTPVAGTGAAGATVSAIAADTLTLPKCIIAENFPIRYQFAARLRKVPLRFRVLPVNGVYYTWS